VNKIVVCDAIHSKGLEILNKCDDIKYIDASNENKEALLDLISDASVVITRSSTDVDKKLLNAAPNLKAIVRAGVGVDNVDINECSKRGIIVMNIPTANTIAAVELTMTHILSSARSFTSAHNHLKIDRIWKREKWYGVELKDKTLGVIGFGNIGSRVSKRALAFDMDVITYDPYIDPSLPAQIGAKYTRNFDDILKCDFITIHTPKNDETTNMITSTEISKMKDGVRLINVARGGLYNEDDLYEALLSGKVSFCGIDVFVKEPATDNRLLELNNISCTPHLGANTLESQERVAVQASQNAINAVRGVNYANALNLPIKDSDIPVEFKLYLELGQKLAYLAAQINRGQVKSIKVMAYGEISNYIESLVTFSLVGALKESMGEMINYVNAKFIADEKKIEIIVDKNRASKVYKNKIEIAIVTDNGSLLIGGTVFDDSIQKIVNINNIELDIKPQGRMIFFKNDDKPGVIAKISQILSSNNLNIVDFRLGSDSKDSAIAVVLIESNLTKDILKQLNSIKECQWVAYATI
jgi:D-3-phosphoglycerate dehydrogenase